MDWHVDQLRPTSGAQFSNGSFSIKFFFLIILNNFKMSIEFVTILLLLCFMFWCFDHVGYNGSFFKN